MKKAFAIFSALVLMPASQSMAWMGGPFSNNNALPGGDDGIYEAIATTSNGLGIFRFAVRNNGASSEAAGSGGTNSNGAATGSSNVQFSAGLLGSSSSNVWYYKGITYYGTAFGTVNSEFGIVAAVGNAESNSPTFGSLQGQGGNTGAAFTPGTGGTNGVVIANPQGNNIGFANSQFTAKIKDRESPTLRFKGSGEVSFVGEADVVADVEAINPVTITPGGVFTPVTSVGSANTPPGSTSTLSGTFDRNENLDLNPATGNNDPNNQITTSTFNLDQSQSTNQTSFNSSTRVSTGGEDSSFSQRGHSRKFVVFGSRVSATVTP